TAVTVFSEERRHFSECAIEEALAPRVSDDRAHFACEFAEIAGEEPLVLPIEAGGLEKVFAIEISADSHLHSFDEINQDEARGGACPSCCKHGPPIIAGLMTADDACRIRAIRLQHVARRSLIDESFRFIDVREFEYGGCGKPQFGENALGISAVIFKT